MNLIDGRIEEYTDPDVSGENADYRQRRDTRPTPRLPCCSTAAASRVFRAGSAALNGIGAAEVIRSNSRMRPLLPPHRVIIEVCSAANGLTRSKHSGSSQCPFPVRSAVPIPFKEEAFGDGLLEGAGSNCSAQVVATGKRSKHSISPCCAFLA